MPRLSRFIVVFSAACGAAIIISVIPVLVYDLPVEVIHVLSRPWWAVCAFGLGLLQPFAAAFGVALGLPLTILLLEGLSGFGNLGPIAAAITFLQAGVPAAIGAALGGLSRAAIKRLLSVWGYQPPSGVAICVVSILVVLFSIIVAFTSAHHEAEANAVRASSAKSKLEVLWRAQSAFNVQKGTYACSLSELGVPFEDGIREHPVSSSGYEQGYQFTLRCRQRKPAITSSFDIHASPLRYSGTYARMAKWRYCVDERGDLRTVGVGEKNIRCLESGEIASRLSNVLN